MAGAGEHVAALGLQKPALIEKTPEAELQQDQTGEGRQDDSGCKQAKARTPTGTTAGPL